MEAKTTVFGPKPAVTGWHVGCDKGIRMVVGHELAFEVRGIAVRP